MVHYDYSTVSEAINKLAEKGYTTDFNLPSNIDRFESGEWDGSKFNITGVYRYEGQTDPADEAVVYAIESDSGIKGVLVAGFGASSGQRSKTVLDMINKPKTNS